jgi:cation:H+ antiporter
MDLMQWGFSLLIGLLVVGLALLFKGGDWLVSGSSQIARIFGIHPVVVGLTIVALGTSMPEFLVSLMAAITDKPDFALGNVVGSNIANICLILGLSAVFTPLVVNKRLLKFEVPLLIAASAVFWLLCLGDSLSRFEGLLLTAGFLFYLFIVVRKAQVDSAIRQENKKNSIDITVWKNIFWVAIGIVALWYGAKWTIAAASEISRRFGVSELTIGLTVVALGTSLPELAASLVAAIRKEADITIGNVIGSNIFNMMAVAGPTAAIKPLRVSDDLTSFNLPAMFILTFLLYPILKSSEKITRVEGALLLTTYIIMMLVWTQ